MSNQTTFEVQTIVIGAGVVGLACAAKLAANGREVLVLERNFAIGEEVSARNSEVIHAGIYYPPGSRKARVCVEGKQKLYQYCAEHGVATRRPGKLIVATSEADIVTLEELKRRGEKNKVDDLEWLSATEARQLEPALRCHAALLSPSTGIVDSHGLMLALQGQLESFDGGISFGCNVTGIDQRDGRLSVAVMQDGAKILLATEAVINCGGLSAVSIARQTKGIDLNVLPQAHYAKGNYFRLQGATPFSHLVYPAPEVGGLGVHLTLDIDGNARFGPDVEPADSATASLDVNPAAAEKFYERIRMYWPALKDNSLLPDYAGLRPKIKRPGQSHMDFEILDVSHHGIPRLIHCLGIESPGLTSSLAIADEVAQLLT